MGMPDVRIVIRGVNNFSRSLMQSMGDAEKFSRKMTTIGKGMSVAVSAPLAGIAAMGVKTSMSLNESMGNISTLLDGTNAEILSRVTKYKKSVQEVSKFTGRDAKETADGMFDLISAFGETADLTAQLKINALSAVGGQASLSEAIGLTAAVTKSYGDSSAKAMQNVSDLAFMTNKLGSMDFKQLAASMGQVAPIAAQAGVSMKEMFAVMASASGVVGTTDETATKLSDLSASFIKPTKNLEKVFKMLGYESGSAMLKEKGLLGSLQAVKGVTDKYHVTLGKVFESKEALILSTALLTQLTGDYTTKLEAMNSASGATQKAFDVQVNGINKTGVEYQRMTQRVNEQLVALGDKLLPLLMKFADKFLIPAVNWFSKLNDGQMNFIIVVGGIVTAMGPLLVVAGSTATLFTTVLIPAFTAVSASIFEATGVAIGFNIATGGILLAIGLLVAGVVLLIQHWKTLKFYIMPVITTIGSAIRILVCAFDPLLGILILIGMNLDNIARLAKTVGNGVKGLWNGITGGGGTPAQGNGPAWGSNGAPIGTPLGANGMTQTAVGGASNNFVGSLTFANMPQGSRLDVQNAGGLDIQSNYGFNPVGVRR